MPSAASLSAPAVFAEPLHIIFLLGDALNHRPRYRRAGHFLEKLNQTLGSAFMLEYPPDPRRIDGFPNISGIGIIRQNPMDVAASFFADGCFAIPVFPGIQIFLAGDDNAQPAAGLFSSERIP